MRWAAIATTTLLCTAIATFDPATAQQAPVATFKSSIDLVRIAAVVRDRKGRFVDGMLARDLEVVDDGESRAITDLRRDIAGVSVALLFDVSGSMEVARKLTHAREAASHLLSWLEPARDEAAVFTFDTRLDEITRFTTGLRALPDALNTITPFGATSLHDAIAATARRLASREGRRRAIVVLTDGDDNASRLTPAEVSGIASAIDVPVYIFGIVAPIDDPAANAVTPVHSSLTGPLADLAAWTGGYLFVASTPAHRSVAARQIVDELRHQYLIAFESGGKPGWHSLVIRARGKDVVVRARSGYVAGQSRPSTE